MLIPFLNFEIPYYLFPIFFCGKLVLEFLKSYNKYQKILNESFKGITLAFMLDLNYLDGNEVGKLYNNKERFETLKSLTWAEQYDAITRSYYVLVKDNEELKPAKLDIELIFERK